METLPESPVETREVSVTLDGWEGPGTMGLVMAEKRGYFADAGLDAELFTPATPERSVEYVVNGTDDLGVSHEPQVVLAKEKGAPIVIIGSLIPQPTAAMIWLRKSRIGGIAGLRGKTIAFPGLPFQKSLLQSVLARGGLTLDDVRLENVGYKLVPALASGRADAIFGGSWNLEGVRLKLRGLKPVVTPVQDLGIPDYGELVLIARTDRVAEDPQLIRDFLAAVARGDAAAVANPGKAVFEIEEGAESNPESSRKFTRSEVEATLPLLSEKVYTSPDQASRLVDWMYEQEMIRREPPVSALLTNDYG